MARVESRIGWVLYHAKRYDEALEKYKALVERYKDDFKSEETRKVVRETRLILSNICVHLERIPEAEEWLEQVLDEYPTDVSAMNDLGYLWADQGKNLERALKMIQEAVESDPKNKAFRDSLGWCLFRLGRFQEAVPELKLAIEDDVAETDGVIYDHLADAYLAAGQTTEARDTWQLSIQAFEKKGETAKAQKVREKLQTLLDREKEKPASKDGAAKNGEKKDAEKKLGKGGQRLTMASRSKEGRCERREDCDGVLRFAGHESVRHHGTLHGSVRQRRLSVSWRGLIGLPANPARHKIRDGGARGRPERDVECNSNGST